MSLLLAPYTLTVVGNVHHFHCSHRPSSIKTHHYSLVRLHVGPSCSFVFVPLSSMKLAHSREGINTRCSRVTGLSCSIKGRIDDRSLLRRCSCGLRYTPLAA